MLIFAHLSTYAIGLAFARSYEELNLTNYHIFIEFSSRSILYISTALSCTCGVSLEAAEWLSIEPISVTTAVYTRKYLVNNIVQFVYS